jgi:uncharacterized protein (DUF1778 family)
MAGSAAAARMEFRIRPEAKARIELAAELASESASDFARTAAERRADEVLRTHDLVTVVPAGFFEDLLAALDQPAAPNQALTRAARRARKSVTRG